MSTSFLEELWPRAQAALSNSPFFELRELLVEARDDTLFISGRVTSFYHKQLAQEVVRSVCRDAELINSIDVEPAEEDGY